MKTTQSSQCIYFTIIIHNAKGSVSLSRLHFLYSHIIWQIAKTTGKMLFNGIKTLYGSFSTMIRAQTTLVPDMFFCWLSFRYLHRLGGSGTGRRPFSGVLAETRSRPALQLLTGQTHHEH